MSEIDSEPYFKEIHTEVMGAVDALLDQAIEANTPADYLCTIEDDVSELSEAYDLTPEELEALGNEIASRLQVESVLCRNDQGVYFVQFFIKSVRG